MSIVSLYGYKNGRSHYDISRRTDSPPTTLEMDCHAGKQLRHPRIDEIV